MQDTTPPASNSNQSYMPPQGQYVRRPRKTRWWIPVSIILGIILFMGIGVVGSAMQFFGEKKGSVDENSVLLLDLSGGVTEYSSGGALFFQRNEGQSLFDIISAIDRAKNDPKIKGIYYRAGGSNGSVKLAEIRKALVNFKTSKKFVYAFMESGTKEHYYIASVADSIFMPQDGMMIMNAFGTSSIFMRNLYDKLGVTWHVEQFEEYKSAGETVSRDSWSEPAKNEIRPIIQNRVDMFVNAVSESRKMSPANVLSALDRGVFIPDSMKALGFIDGLSHEADVLRKIQMRVNPKDTSKFPKPTLVSIGKYASWTEDEDSNVDKDHGIAIVYASGVITPGKGSGAQGGIQSKALIADLHRARDNDDVKAIILRIDSPGGSAMASDEIWAAIREVRKTKPVYASMSDVAASGGYYIAMACDTIITHPSTITGSIGVIMTVPNFAGTIGKVGLSTDTVNTGKSSAFMNLMIPLTEADKATLHTFGSQTYQRFVSKVAESRHKDYEGARALAKGRIWTGDAAIGAGLADVSGGLMDAITLVKKRLGVKSGVKVPIYRYPLQSDSFTQFLKLLGLGDDDDAESNSDTQVTLDAIIDRYAQANDPVAIALSKLPVEARRQFEHSVSLLNLSSEEHVLTMMPLAPI